MKSNKAFTLIELLVVVSIISIVSAVFIPLLYREVKQKNANKIVKPYKIGDVVYVKGLRLTGVVKSVNWNCSEVDLFPCRQKTQASLDLGMNGDQ